MEQRQNKYLLQQNVYTKTIIITFSVKTWSLAKMIFLIFSVLVSNSPSSSSSTWPLVVLQQTWFTSYPLHRFLLKVMPLYSSTACHLCYHLLKPESSFLQSPARSVFSAPLLLFLLRSVHNSQGYQLSSDGRSSMWFCLWDHLKPS